MSKDTQLQNPESPASSFNEDTETSQLNLMFNIQTQHNPQTHTSPERSLNGDLEVSTLSHMFNFPSHNVSAPSPPYLVPSPSTGHSVPSPSQPVSATPVEMPPPEYMNVKQEFLTNIKQETPLNSPYSCSSPAEVPVQSPEVHHNSPSPPAPASPPYQPQHPVSVKQEYTDSTINLVDLLEEHQSMLQEMGHQRLNAAKKPSNQKKQNCPILCRYLGDKSYIEKYNHKPVDLTDLASLATNNIKQEPMSEVKPNSTNPAVPKDNLEPFLHLALEQLSKEVDGTCVRLGISAGRFYSHKTPVLFFIWN